jgi:hypothetical protein
MLNAIFVPDARVRRRTPVYTFIRSLPLRSIFAAHGPALAGSWLIAELLYKFGSFTLELAAFLGTWFVIDAVLSFSLRLFNREKASDSGA